MSWKRCRRNWGKQEEGKKRGKRRGATGVINRIQASDVIQAVVWLSLKKEYTFAVTQHYQWTCWRIARKSVL